MSVAGSGKMGLQQLDLDFTDAETLAKKATDEQVIDDMRQYVFSVPPRDYNAAVPFVYVKSHDGTTIALPHGYRLPLMWVAKYQWDTVCRALTDPEGAIAKSWVTQRDEYIYLSFVCRHLLHVASARHAQESGMEKGWRCVAFDRMLTRLYKGYNRNRPEHLEEFVMEYSAKEYDRDVLKYDWKRWVMKDHFGVRLSEDEVNNGITDSQFMHNIRREDGKWLMDPIAPVPLQSSAIHVLDDNNDRSISALLARSATHPTLKAEPHPDVSLSAPANSGPQKRRRTVKLPRATDAPNSDEPPAKRPRRKKATEAATATASSAKPSDPHPDASAPSADRAAADSAHPTHENPNPSFDTPDSRHNGTATAGLTASSSTNALNAGNDRPTIILKLSGPTPSKGPTSNATGAAASSSTHHLSTTTATASPSKNAADPSTTTSKRASRAHKNAAASSSAAAVPGAGSASAAGPSHVPLAAGSSSTTSAATRSTHQHHHHTRTTTKTTSGQPSTATANPTMATAADDDVHAKALDLLVGLLDSRRGGGDLLGSVGGGEGESLASQLQDAVKNLGDVCRNLEKRVATLEGIMSRQFAANGNASLGGNAQSDLWRDPRMSGSTTLLSFNQLLASENGKATVSTTSARGTPTPRAFNQTLALPPAESDLSSPSAAMSALLELSTKLATSNQGSTDVLKDTLSNIVDQMVTMKMLDTIRAIGPNDGALSITSTLPARSSPLPAPAGSTNDGVSAPGSSDVDSADQMDVEPKPSTQPDPSTTTSDAVVIATDSQTNTDLQPSTSTSTILDESNRQPQPRASPAFQSTTTTTTMTTISPHSLIPAELRNIRDELYNRDLTIHDDIASLRKHQLAEIDILRRRLVDLENLVFREYEERERERAWDRDHNRERERERFYQYQYEQERHHARGHSSSGMTNGSGTTIPGAGGVVAYHSLRDQRTHDRVYEPPPSRVPSGSAGGGGGSGTRPHSRVASRAALTAERAMQQQHNPLPPSNALQQAQHPNAGRASSLSGGGISTTGLGAGGGTTNGVRAATPVRTASSNAGDRGSPMDISGGGARGARTTTPTAGMMTPNGVAVVTDTDLPTPTSSEMGDDAPLPIKSQRKQKHFSLHQRQLSKEVVAAKGNGASVEGGTPKEGVETAAATPKEKGKDEEMKTDDAAAVAATA